MGDASQVRLAIAPEATFGVNPAAGFNYLRFNNESLKHAQGVNESGEINPNRQPPGSLRISRSAEGNIVCEDSLITPAADATLTGFDILIKAAMMSSWSTIVALTSQSIDISGVAGGAFTLTDAATAAAFANVVDGQWIKLGGFTQGAIYAHVTTKTSNNVLVCEGVRSGGAAVTNEAGQTDISVSGSMIRIGSTRNSLSIEKQFTDLTVDEYSLMLGALVGQWAWGLNKQEVAQHTWTILGQTLGTLAGSTGAGSPAAVWATQRITAPFDYYMKMEGIFTALATHRISNISFNLDNRPRLDFEVGSQTPQVGIGTPRLTGQFNTYMDDATLQRKLEAGTASKLAFRLNDGTRDRIVTFPAIQYTDGGGFAGGNDQAVEQSLQFAAEPDSEGVAFQIDRLS